MATSVSPGEIRIFKRGDGDAVATSEKNSDATQENAAAHFRPVRARGGASASEIIIRDRGE
jgi:hypothetical protein